MHFVIMNLVSSFQKTKNLKGKWIDKTFWKNAEEYSNNIPFYLQSWFFIKLGSSFEEKANFFSIYAMILSLSFCYIQVMFRLHYSCWCPRLLFIICGDHCTGVTPGHTPSLRPAPDPPQFSTHRHRSSLSCCSNWKTDQSLNNFFQ